MFAQRATAWTLLGLLMTVTTLASPVVASHTCSGGSPGTWAVHAHLDSYDADRYQQYVRAGTLVEILLESHNANVQGRIYRYDSSADCGWAVRTFSEGLSGWTAPSDGTYIIELSTTYQGGDYSYVWTELA